MKTIGIITIHKIYNYGSVFQAFSLQYICEKMGFKVEIIDYNFPNSFHAENKYQSNCNSQSNEPIWIKMLFTKALLCQHQRISSFVRRFQHLSPNQYTSPTDLKEERPTYDIYITGSDQLWNPRFCNGDPAFMLHFAPDRALKISYAASFGANVLPKDLEPLYKKLLNRYAYISVRENSGKKVMRDIIGMESTVVLDPTLLLNRDEWNKIASSKRQLKKKYILCYYLNYTFNSFPHADNLATYIQKLTGYEIVRVARPPHKLFVPHTHYRIGASPEEFLALIRDAEMVLTTSFHGTAFAINYGKPVFTIVKDRMASDSRQVSLMENLGMEQQVLSIKDPFPTVDKFTYDVEKVQRRLEILRQESKQYLFNALHHG